MKPDTGPTGPSSFESLVESALTGRLTASDAVALRDHLHRDRATVEEYLDQVRLHALLEWRSGKVMQAGVGATGSDVRHTTLVASSPDASQSAGGDHRDHKRLAGHIAGALLLPIDQTTLQIRPEPTRQPARRAIAAVLVLCFGMAAYLVHQTVTRPMSSSTASGVGFIAGATDVVWSPQQRQLKQGDAVAAGALSIEAGTLKIIAGSGATITLVGPTRVQLVSPMKMNATMGRVTVRVDDDRAKGFSVETPHAEVIDLGTEFGVQVDGSGQTNVVVFDGKVDLSPHATRSAGEPASPIRLSKGEGLRVDLAGLLRPIVAVDRWAGSPEWRIGTEVSSENDFESVIAAVRDNRRDPSDTRYYQIVRRGLVEDVPAYVDRVYQWNSLVGDGLAEPATRETQPPVSSTGPTFHTELHGADLIQTFNSDKREQDLELTVVLSRPAVLYVFHEPRLGEAPDWLKRDFVDTGLKIGLDEGSPDMPQLALRKGPGSSIDRIFTVWRRDVREPMSVTLGRNSPSSKSMYGVAAKPLDVRH